MMTRFILYYLSPFRFYHIELLRHFKYLNIYILKRFVYYIHLMFRDHIQKKNTKVFFVDCFILNSSKKNDKFKILGSEPNIATNEMWFTSHERKV